jgi:hypothetical protein
MNYPAPTRTQLQLHVFERADTCRHVTRPLLLYNTLMGQWRYSLVTDRLSATIQIAKRISSLAQEQDDPALVTGACQALVPTFFFLGDFESARQHAIRSVDLALENYKVSGRTSRPARSGFPVL